MDCTKPINVKIRDYDKNVIDRDFLAISTNDKSRVVVESGEGGIVWEGEEGLVTEGSSSGNVALETIIVEESINKSSVRWCKESEAGHGANSSGEIVGVKGVSKDTETTWWEGGGHQVWAEGFNGGSDYKEGYKE